MSDKLLYSKSRFDAQDLEIADLHKQLECLRLVSAREAREHGALLGWRRHRNIEWVAAGGLKPNDRPDGWIATTRDPKMLLPLASNAPFLQIRFSACFAKDSARLAAMWQVFLDHGDGYNEEDSHSVPLRGAELEIDVFLPLRRPIVQIRIDPIDTAGEITIRNLEIIEWSFLAGIWHSARRRRAQIHQDPQRRGYREAGAALRAVMPRKALVTLLYVQSERRAPYERWIEARAMTKARRGAFVTKAADLARRPLFSIIMATYESPLRFLELAIASIERQTYADWELCVTDDGSTNPEVAALLRRKAEEDARIKPEFLDRNSGISAASNAALARARGDFIVLVDHDDEIAPHALFAMAAALDANPDADWLYSDEDKIDEDGRRSDPFFKPDWSPTYFLSLMYTCHLGVYRRALVQRLGGFRSGFDMAQDYDLALRIASVTRNVVHVPDILYHWRTLATSTASGAHAKPRAEVTARKAVQDFIDRSDFAGTCVAGVLPGLHKVEFAIKGTPRVSIVIPTAGRRADTTEPPHWYVADFVRSIRDKTTYPSYEILVIENGDLEPDLERRLAALGVTFVRYASRPFNLSEKINLGVAAATGEYVAVLNDDMAIIEGDWLRAMLSWCQLPDIAAVGGKLLFPNDLVQHVGVVLFDQGPSHICYMHSAHDVGLVASAITCREYSAVTGACLMTRTADFRAIGGFSLDYPTNYNDIDFCLRLTDHTKGRILVCPEALLYHIESVSKDDNPARDLERFNTRWAHRRGLDPYYNPHLSQLSTSWDLDLNFWTLEDQYGLQAEGGRVRPRTRP